MRPAPAMGQVLSQRWLEADWLLRSLAESRDRHLGILASAAEVLAKRACAAFGYSNRNDLAREHLGKSGRWLSDHAALGELLRTFPTLAEATCGTDGKPPLGRVVALAIGRVATPATIDALITRARKLTTRETLQLARKIRRPDMGAERIDVASLNGSAGSQSSTVPTDASSRLDISMPASVRVAFEEVFELFRAVSGENGSVTSFLEALVAESSTSALSGDPETTPTSTISRSSLPASTPDTRKAASSGDTASTALLDEKVHPGTRLRQGVTWPASRRQRMEWLGGFRPYANTPATQQAFETLARFSIASSRIAADLQTELQATSSLEVRRAAGASSREPKALTRLLPRRRDGLWSRESRNHLQMDQKRNHSRLEEESDPSRIGRLLQATKEMIALEGTLERCIARLLAELEDERAFEPAGFKNAVDYAVECLGMSGSSTRSRVRLARCLQGLPVVHDAYEKGQIGSERAELIRRALGASRVDASMQRLHVNHARETTIKRLRDESRTLQRRRLLLHEDSYLEALAQARTIVERTRSTVRSAGPNAQATSPSGFPASNPITEVKTAAVRRRWHVQGPSPHDRTQQPNAVPLSDVEWLDSIRRTPGQTWQQVFGLGHRILESGRIRRPCYEPCVSDVVLRLTLPDELWHSLRAALDSACHSLQRLASLEQRPGEAARQRPAIRIAQMLSSSAMPHQRRLPHWLGLLALLEEFVCTWDDPAGMPRHRNDRILDRDGWRCAAPGCTMRRHIEVHHVRYRSQGGGDEDSNRICLCHFHHQHGEHGTCARVRGQAPGSLYWRLGCSELGLWYLNERVIQRPRARDGDPSATLQVAPPLPAG